MIRLSTESLSHSLLLLLLFGSTSRSLTLRVEIKGYDDFHINDWALNGTLLPVWIGGIPYYQNTSITYTKDMLMDTAPLTAKRKYAGCLTIIGVENPRKVFIHGWGEFVNSTDALPYNITGSRVVTGRNSVHCWRNLTVPAGITEAEEQNGNDIMEENLRKLGMLPAQSWRGTDGCVDDTLFRDSTGTPCWKYGLKNGVGSQCGFEVSLALCSQTCSMCNRDSCLWSAATPTIFPPVDDRNWVGLWDSAVATTSNCFKVPDIVGFSTGQGMYFDLQQEEYGLKKWATWQDDDQAPTDIQNIIFPGSEANVRCCGASRWEGWQWLISTYTVITIWDVFVFTSGSYLIYKSAQGSWYQFADPNGPILVDHLGFIIAFLLNVVGYLNASFFFMFEPNIDTKTNKSMSILCAFRWSPTVFGLGILLCLLWKSWEFSRFHAWFHRSRLVLLMIPYLLILLIWLCIDKPFIQDDPFRVDNYCRYHRGGVPHTLIVIYIAAVGILTSLATRQASGSTLGIITPLMFTVCLLITSFLIPKYKLEFFAFILILLGPSAVWAVLSIFFAFRSLAKLKGKQTYIESVGMKDLGVKLRDDFCLEYKNFRTIQAHSDDKAGGLILLVATGIKSVTDQIGFEEANFAMRYFAGQFREVCKRNDTSSFHLYRTAGDRYVILTWPKNFQTFRKIVVSLSKFKWETKLTKKKNTVWLHISLLVGGHYATRVDIDTAEDSILELQDSSPSSRSQNWRIAKEIFST